MALNFQNLPIFEDADYEYTVTLNRVSFKLRLYYIEREKRWAMDLAYGDRTPIIYGAAVVPSYPIFIDYYIPDFLGFFWLEPVGREASQSKENQLQLGEYYRLVYYYETEDEDGSADTSQQNLLVNCWRRDGCN